MHVRASAGAKYTLPDMLLQTLHSRCSEYPFDAGTKVRTTLFKPSFPPSPMLLCRGQHRNLTKSTGRFSPRGQVEPRGSAGSCTVGGRSGKASKGCLVVAWMHATKHIDLSSLSSSAR
jgi:hypothetical protein